MSDTETEVNRIDVAREAMLIIGRKAWSLLVFLAYLGTVLGFCAAIWLAFIWIFETYEPTTTVILPSLHAAINAVPGPVWFVLRWGGNILGLLIWLAIAYAILSRLWKKAEERARGETNGE